MTWRRVSISGTHIAYGLTACLILPTGLVWFEVVLLANATAMGMAYLINTHSSLHIYDFCPSYCGVASEMRLSHGGIFRFPLEVDRYP